MLLSLYRGLTTAAGPLVPLLLDRRQAAGKEDAARRGERLGEPSRPRPPGPLVWVHAASVGEALSVQALIGRLLRRRPDLHVLMTTGTVTSARLLAERLPARALHQFVPLDRAPYARRFLDAWRPDLVLWVESDLWPNLLGEVRRRGIPAALLNARMSAASFARWRRFPGPVRRLLGAFSVILPWNEREADKLRALGAAGLGPAGNLKLAMPPPPADAAALEALAGAIAGRPVWMAASTHAGEETAAFAAHRALAAARPHLLTVVAPRHPARGGEVEALAAGAGLAARRRSAGALPAPGTEVYVADTIGEMGTLLRAVPIAFIGGSLVPHGGHNPIEAAQLGAAILYGPHMTNFPETVEQLGQAGAAVAVADAAALTQTLARLLADPAERQRLAAAAATVAAGNRDILERALAALEPLLARLDRREAAE